MIVAGRLAASGDFRAIRRLMTDRPYSFTVRSSDNRGFAVALLGDASVFGVELNGDRLTVRTSLFSEFVRAAPRVARASGITIRELVPADESLESVFSYLVNAMNTTVFTLTLRQIGGQRRILLVGLIAAILAPIGLALIYRAGDFDDPLDWTANTLLDSIIITVVLPLACLLVGTSAMGTEIEDGTAVYLLSKPLPRREIIFAKAAAAILVAAAFLLPAAVAGAAAIAGGRRWRRARARIPHRHGVRHLRVHHGVRAAERRDRAGRCSSAWGTSSSGRASSATCSPARATSASASTAWESRTASRASTSGCLRLSSAGSSRLSLMLAVIVGATVAGDALAGAVRVARRGLGCALAHCPFARLPIVLATL